MKQEQAKENLKVFHEAIPYFSNNSSLHSMRMEAEFLQIFSKSRVKRSDNGITLVEATTKKDYTYWLSQEDIVDIARVEYNNYKSLAENYSGFEVLGSILQLNYEIESLKSKIQKIKTSRCTYIINLKGSHWVTLVIFYENNQYGSYYIDSKNEPFPLEYQQLLLKHIGKESLNVSPAKQQTDEHNCALWALENAADLNEMLDSNRSLSWLSNKFKLPRDREYFRQKRQLLSEKLRADPSWRARHLLLPFGFSIASSSIGNDQSTAPKPLEFQLQPEDPTTLQEIFTETFIAFFTKKLAAFHLTAKGEKLTAETLKTELTAGTTGALLGMSISQNILGSIPSLVASLRTLSNKYYTPNKGKAQRITRIFSKLTSGILSPILSETAVDIFYSFESQFMHITDKAGDRVAMEKLAEDAAERIFNSIEKRADEITSIDKVLLEQGVISGPSEKFFDPSVKRARLRISGNKLQDKKGNSINTANLYEKVGLVVVNEANQRQQFYVNKAQSDSNQYGYRRLLGWEKGEDGEIKEDLKEHYQEDHPLLHEETSFQFNSRNYDYILRGEATQQVAQIILTKIQNRFPIIEKDRPQQSTTKNPILFNLNKPIKNFTGRVKLLEELHKMLMLGRTTAVVPAFSRLSIHPVFDAPDQLSSGSQVSVSGLGGIGKTQLALRYAELSADAYDHNILWINAETKENLFYSFHKLATKLHLETRDRYGQKKDMDDIIEEVYEYFSDRKSLFIFDNVENYRAIATYLPKSMLGNKPTVLITSRYSHWENVASVLSLDVFTEQESKELIKNSLELRHNNEDEKIIELNQLLQGLPLALQQAIAYIKLRKSTDARFSLHNYIELYKQTSRGLLDFDFSQYNNDPYLKTVFTTWQITLDKIQSDPLVGDYAIKILNIVAYLDPDNISSSLFNYLQNDHLVASILNLLKGYSMINLGNQENKYTVHRLVQQVARINLERNTVKFREIAREVETLFANCIDNAENNFHFMHFLLYMSEYKELKHLFLYNESSIMLFDHLESQNIRYWTYFLDLAYLKFPKQKYLNFLGDALAFCIKKNSLSFLPELLNYIENKWIAKNISKENIKYITEYLKTVKGTVYSLNRFSRIQTKKESQITVIKIIYDFRLKIFGNIDLYDACASHNLKRAINLCSLAEDDNERISAARNQILRFHLQKVVQVSHWISSALFTKDTLSALLQNEFKMVAINFALITSNTILGKLSNTLFVQGEKLTADDALLLEKELDFESKIAFHLLLDENVLSAGKRRFLGNSMKVASSFIKRGTSVFFAANLIDDIKKENKEGIIFNGAIISVDITQASIEGLEYLDFLTEVSTVTGPVGEAISVLAWLGTDVYHTEQQVEKIKENVHLSKTETFIQNARAFFHLAPSEYLIVKSNNNQLVQGAIDFLKKHAEIRYFIFSSFQDETVLHENNQVSLDVKRKLILDNDNPDEPSEGNLFCLSGRLANPEGEEDRLSTPSFLCQNAVGVEYSINRTGNLSFINLGQGDDSAIALLSSPTIFLVEGGRRNYLGSDKEDLFILIGDSSITGLLQGNRASDTLNFSSFYPKKTDYLLIDINGFLCEKNNSTELYVQLICHHPGNSLKLNGINQLIGRKNQQEIVYLGPETHLIDGYGGLDEDHPDNFFITPQSYGNPKLVLRNNTVVIFFLNTNTKSVDYQIPAGESGTTLLKFNFTENSQHKFFFDYTIEAIKQFTMNATQLTLVTEVPGSNEKIFSLQISDPYSTFKYEESAKNITAFPANISYFFQGLAMKLVNSNHIYLQEIAEINNQTIDEKINRFITLTERLKKPLSVQLMDNTTISIGQGKHEIFYTQVLSESHLVGNGGENVYILLPGNPLLPLPEVILYDIFKEDLNDELTEEWGDTLDLRAIINKVNLSCPAMQKISTEILPMENDLVLSLSIPFYTKQCVFLDSFWYFSTIRLRHALLNNWYQKLDIFLQDAIPKNIVFTDNETWDLEEVPLVFTDEKKIIFITVNDIGEKSEIFLLKNAENYRFFQNKADLILTNAFDRPVDYWTIICHKFYEIPEMREKILSVSFHFFEKVIRPQDHQAEIDQASEFSETIPIETASSPLNSPSTLSPLLMRQGLDHQSSRARRHLNLESDITKADIKQIPSKASGLSHRRRDQDKQIIRKESILTTADNYLKNYEATQSKHQRSFNKKLPRKNKIEIEQAASSINSVQTRTEKASQKAKKISCKQDILTHSA